MHPGSDGDVGFRPLEVSDLPRLTEWFAEPEIARWWNEDPSLDAVVAKYGPRIENAEPTLMWIIEIGGSAAGLMQSYLYRDYPDYDAAVGVADSIGIDYLLSDAFSGRGRCAGAIRAFARYAFDLYPDAACCVATPAQANDPSWRCLERAGFERRGECQPPGEPLAFTYAITRAAPAITD